VAQKLLATFNEGDTFIWIWTEIPDMRPTIELHTVLRASISLRLRWQRVWPLRQQLALALRESFHLLVVSQGFCIQFAGNYQVYQFNFRIMSIVGVIDLVCTYTSSSCESAQLLDRHCQELCLV
jgi:hypothetical protein